MLVSANNITFKAAYAAGKINTLPDPLSRVKIRPTEWSLNRSEVHRYFRNGGFL